jgi:hypothetical protein
MTSARASIRASTFLSLCLALCGIAPGVALAQHDHDGHGHQHGPDKSTAAAVTQLQLDGQAKWATDAALRAGMGRIREAFDADHSAIHAGRETDAAYAALATRIESEVNVIVATCKLPPAADANLHYIVADLLRGANLMRQPDATQTRHQGAALVHGALNAYGRFFDDPSWTSVVAPAGG